MQKTIPIYTSNKINYIENNMFVVWNGFPFNKLLLYYIIIYDLTWRISQIIIKIIFFFLRIYTIFLIEILFIGIKRCSHDFFMIFFQNMYIENNIHVYVNMYKCMH